MWIFFLSDAVLLGTAGFVAMNSDRPLSTAAVFTIFACIFGGALIALVPLIARFERQKNEALDERQRELEALARTVTSSAEQISIAASGLPEISDLVQKNLRYAEQLPHKLQERVAELQARLVAVADGEREELEKELETLRASDSERLESIATKIAKSTVEWTKLETASRQHLEAANEAIGKLSSGTAAAISKSQAAAEQALGQAGTEAARIFAEATLNATKALDAARAAAVTEMDARLARAASLTLPASIPAPVAAPESKSTATALATPPPPAPEPIAALPSPEPVAPTPTADPVDESPEPAPVPRESIPEVVPVIPASTNPFPEPAAPDATPNGTSALPTPAKPTRKKAPKKPIENEPTLGIDESTPNAESDAGEGFQSGVVERVLTSDGATRLLVTAYIGIGNRLFIRGEGPGLTWEKGVPLQFVSIGKWRWETNDATAPVSFKILKNDEVECVALGTKTLDPGHQNEVTAAV